MSNTSDNRTEVSRHRVSNVAVEYSGDDPFALLAVFSHLRNVLGGPDIADVEANLTVVFDTMRDDQVAMLEALGGAGWGLNWPKVAEVREYIEYSDGLTEIRRLSDAGALLEAPEWRDATFHEIAPPDSN